MWHVVSEVGATGRRRAAPFSSNRPPRRRLALDDEIEVTNANDVDGNEIKEENEVNQVKEEIEDCEQSADDEDEDKEGGIDLTGSDEADGAAHCARVIDLCSDNESDRDDVRTATVDDTVVCVVHGPGMRPIAPLSTANLFSEQRADATNRYWANCAIADAHLADWRPARDWLLGHGCNECTIDGDVVGTSVFLACSALLPSVTALSSEPVWAELVQRHIAAMRNAGVSLDVLERALQSSRVRDIALESIFSVNNEPLFALDNGKMYCAANAAIQALASCSSLFVNGGAAQQPIVAAWTQRSQSSPPSRAPPVPLKRFPLRLLRCSWIRSTWVHSRSRTSRSARS